MYIVVAGRKRNKYVPRSCNARTGSIRFHLFEKSWCFAASTIAPARTTKGQGNRTDDEVEQKVCHQRGKLLCAIAECAYSIIVSESMERLFTSFARFIGREILLRPDLCCVDERVSTIGFQSIVIERHPLATRTKRYINERHEGTGYNAVYLRKCTKVRKSDSPWKVNQKCVIQILHMKLPFFKGNDFRIHQIYMYRLVEEIKCDSKIGKEPELISFEDWSRDLVESFCSLQFKEFLYSMYDYINRYQSSSIKAYCILLTYFSIRSLILRLYHDYRGISYTKQTRQQ